MEYLIIFVLPYLLFAKKLTIVTVLPSFSREHRLPSSKFFDDRQESGWTQLAELDLEISSLNGVNSITPGLELLSMYIGNSLENSQACRVAIVWKSLWKAKIAVFAANYGLQIASACCHERIVRLLINKGTEINAQDRKYGSALYAASLRGREQVVKMLLDNGADVNAPGGEYGNALYAASIKGDEQVVQLLLDNGADVNTQGGVYSNALSAASIKGDEQVVKLLLEKGANVNAHSREYGTALYAASSRGYEQVVKLLLDNGADDLRARAIPMQRFIREFSYRDGGQSN